MVSKINRSILFSFLFLGLATGNMFAATANEKTKLDQAKEISGTIIKAGFNIAKIAIPVTSAALFIAKIHKKSLGGDILKLCGRNPLSCAPDEHLMYDFIIKKIITAATILASIPVCMAAIHSIKNAYYPSKERQKIATKKSYWQGIKSGMYSAFVKTPQLCALAGSATAGTYYLYTGITTDSDPAESILYALTSFITTYVCADSLKHAS